MANTNVLIVEDDEEWRGSYFRAATEYGVTTVSVAENLTDAEELISGMQFALAFIDIGLNEDDDRNRDGLKVMEKIREMRDQTSIIVVTGRSGRDVLPITRAALRDYEAFEIVSKVEIGPETLAGLVDGGLERFRATNSSAGGAAAYLRGTEAQLLWDHHMLSGLPVKGGVQGLYGFLDQLLQPYLPLVPKLGTSEVSLDADGAALGLYWSRAIGEAVRFCFGAQGRMHEEVERARQTRSLRDKHRVGEMLRERSASGLSGAVFQSIGESRGDFGD